MGKEQELLEAARTGNVALIERFLASRVRRSQGGSALTSALASFWNFKGVNVNCVDTNGETPLHLAALNGHKDVVTILLQNEALVNTTDERGCTALHLASWSGRSDICTLLLQPSASPAQINLQNSDGETPLHCAAQHGHCGTVSVLLQDNADPTIRNLGEFSPLDLAAQYGRLDVVKQLITTHPTLVENLIPNHSPLHLASRSGHHSIVLYLLDSGFSVNLKTDAGTPLHEAATYCKTDVIKLLLDRGVDVQQKDNRDLTAADILKSLPSQKAHDATKLISDHIKGLTKVVMQDRTPSEDEYEFSVPEDVKPVPESELPNLSPISPPFAELYAKVNKDKEDVKRGDREKSPVSPDMSPPPLPPRAPSIRCSVSSTESEQRSAPVVSPPVACSPGNGSYVPMGTKEQPRKPPRKKRSTTPNQDGDNGGDKHNESDNVGTTTDDSLSSHIDISEDYVAMGPVPGKSSPPKNPEPSPIYCNVASLTRSQDSPKSANEDKAKATDEESQSSHQTPVLPVAKERKSLMNATSPKQAKDYVPSESVSKPLSESVDVSNATETISSDDLSKSEASAIEKEIPDNPENVSAENGNSVSKKGDAPERVLQKPNSLEFDNKRTSVEVPLSPTGYVQPPTPDYPPPSPSTALQGITQKINPQEKRKSKDMETLTEASILAGLVEKSNKPDVVPSTNNNVETQNLVKTEDNPDLPTVIPKERIPSQILETVVERVEEPHSGSNGDATDMEKKDKDRKGVLDADSTEHVQLRRRISSETSEADTSVFAGLLRGSTPGGPRNVKSQICESDVVRQIKSKRRSTPSSLLSFENIMEKDDDKEAIDANDNIDANDVLSGLDDALKNNAISETTANHTHKSDDANIDESEEWANIAATLAEFGVGMARESVFVREYEADFARLLAATNKIQSVGEWLETLRLGQFENTLVANGFDDTDFLGGNILEDHELEVIGVTEIEHRNKLLNAAKTLPALKPIDLVQLPPSVDQWLKSLRLEQYLDTFNSHKYDTMERVVKVWELELTNVLDITSIGHRKRILASLGNRPAPERINTTSSPKIVKKNTATIQGVEVISPFDHIDLYKDYTGVKSTAVDDPDQTPSQNPLLMFGTGNDDLGQGQHIRDSTVHIRPPHLAHTTGSVRQWRHRPEILIKGCCNYTAQYLGSTLVKELNGPESTQAGISKLKQRLRRKLQVMARYCKKFVDDYLEKSTEVIAKIPTIMLSISYRGVKFIDAKSKKVICDHEIANIFCACQDSEHLNFFAYITKDRETQKHYCHVFSVRSRELAGEIILTLGEAFEIAYQMALKEKAEEDAMEFEKKLSPSDQEDTTSASSKASLNTM